MKTLNLIILNLISIIVSLLGLYFVMAIIITGVKPLYEILFIMVYYLVILVSLYVNNYSLKLFEKEGNGFFFKVSIVNIFISASSFTLVSIFYAINLIGGLK